MFMDELHKRLIIDLDEGFPNILNGETHVANAIEKINEVTNQTFIFLIDEWDVIIRESNDEKLKNDFIRLLRTLFKSSETSKCFDLVYMTGILPIKRYRCETTIKIFKELTMLSSKPISEFMGFTMMKLNLYVKNTIWILMK